MDTQPDLPSGDLFYETLLGSYLDAPHFVERSWLAERIESHLISQDRRFVLFTSGPGIGKTAVGQQGSARLG